MSELQYAEAIVNCYRQLSEMHSNVIWELLDKDSEIYEWQHYPKGDVKDRTHHTQYYYHSHPSKDADRIPDHGHIHCFFNLNALPSEALTIKYSKKYLDSDGKQDALCHVIAIAMNEQGLPTALFTVNHWVVQGLWYAAEDICRALANYKVEIVNSEFSITNYWLTNLIQLFLPQIEALLYKRDEVIQTWQKENPGNDVYEDHNLEVTSLFRFSDIESS